jgi:hypothetical protein
MATPTIYDSHEDNSSLSVPVVVLLTVLAAALLGFFLLGWAYWRQHRNLGGGGQQVADADAAGGRTGTYRGSCIADRFGVA